MNAEKLNIDAIIQKLCIVSDATLVADLDKKKFLVVRKIFADSSKYFEQLLKSNEEIIVQNVDGQTLKSIIGFIYTEYVDLCDLNVAKILAAASSMELRLLKGKCAEYYAKHLCTENCTRTLKRAMKYQLTDLKAKALQVMWRNLPKATILQLDPPVFMEMVPCKGILVGESYVFTCLIEWIATDETGRKKYAADLLKSIRLDLLPGEDLLSKVKPFFVKFELASLVENECNQRVRAFEPLRTSRS